MPCLGDIPYLGWLFKSETEEVDRTNLLIFLTPRIVASASEAEEIHREKAIYMDELRGSSPGQAIEKPEPPKAVEPKKAPEEG